MNNKTSSAWELLSEELNPETLQQLSGGAAGSSWPGHDLVTPDGWRDPYNDDINIDDLLDDAP